MIECSALNAGSQCPPSTQSTPRRVRQSLPRPSATWHTWGWNVFKELHSHVHLVGGGGGLSETSWSFFYFLVIWRQWQLFQLIQHSQDSLDTWLTIWWWVGFSLWSLGILQHKSAGWSMIFTADCNTKIKLIKATNGTTVTWGKIQNKSFYCRFFSYSIKKTKMKKTRKWPEKSLFIARCPNVLRAVSQLVLIGCFLTRL